MHCKLKSLVQEFESKSNEVEKILQKGENLGVEDLSRAKGLNGELGILKDQISGLQEIQKQSLSYQEFLHSPVSSLQFPVNAGLVGFHKSGETVIDGNGILHQDGEGLVDQKTFQAISSTEYKGAFRSYLRKGEWGLSPSEVKTLQMGSDTEGGFLVPQEMLQKIVQKEPSPSRVAHHVTQLSTSRDSLLIPKVDYGADDIYTNGMRVTWTGESFSHEGIHQVEEPRFGQISIPIHTAMMSLRVSNDMVEDSLFPIQSWCADKFRETIELLQDEMILKGNGVGQPSGILKNTGGIGEPEIMKLWKDGQLDPDQLQKLSFSLPEQYVSKSRWIFNLHSMGLSLAQLKDAQKRPLWGMGLHDAGLENGYLDRRLFGFPVIFSGLMPNNTDGKASVILGDLSGYYLINRVGFSVQVLREVEALRNRLVLVGRLRFGGAVAEPWKLKVGVSGNV